MKRVILILVSLCFCTLVMAQNHALDASRYADEEKWAEAISEYELAREAEKSNPLPYLNHTFGESNCYYMLDNYAKVKELADDFYDYWHSNESEVDEQIQSSHYNKMMGTYYYGKTDENPSAYYMAEEYYLNSLDSIRNAIHRTNKDGISYQKMKDDIKVLHLELAQLYYKWEKYDSALVHLNELNADNNNEASLYCSQKAMCLARTGNFNVAIDSINKALTGLKGNSQEYPEALRKKAKILMMQTDSLGTDNWAQAKQCYEQYVDYRKYDVSYKISSLSGTDQEKYWLGMHRFLYDCYRLGNHAPGMLYDLTLFSKGYLLEYKNNPHATRKTWQEVKLSLKSEECAIEFVQYYGKNDAKYLAAIVLKNTMTKPQFIQLCCVDSLKRQVVGGYTVESALQSSEDYAKDDLYGDSTIYENYIWTSELKKSIGSASKVYFSPDGILNSWAIEYEYPDTAKTLYRLSSTRLLINRKKTDAKHNALLCGGVNYDKYQDFKGKSASPKNDRFAYVTWHNRAQINYLRGSLKEVETIDTIRAKHYNDSLIVGDKATDELLCSIISKKEYPVIHISTHGFFFSNDMLGTDFKSSISDNSLSQSGIVMAGAQKLLNDPQGNETRNDGLLTAKEMSEMDMSNVQLMVLSACQTGRGIMTDDGVYGMQRGLKMAGVKSMMVSLWNVNDKATCELMSKFYEELTSCNDVVKAFTKARHRLIEEHLSTSGGRFSARSLSSKSKKSYNKPRYTNAFILIDAL